ncbi:hypothetical protein A4F85_01105 [Delftia sp. GW456-R20]|nr:hypothetical protein A4F85_01105 [Delftia sp. GW456-R20]
MIEYDFDFARINIHSQHVSDDFQRVCLLLVCWDGWNNKIIKVFVSISLFFQLLECLFYIG